MLHVKWDLLLVCAKLSVVFRLSPLSFVCLNGCAFNLLSQLAHVPRVRGRCGKMDLHHFEPTLMASCSPFEWTWSCMHLVWEVYWGIRRYFEQFGFSTGEW